MNFVGKVISVNRYKYLDNLRATLMTLGLVLHTCAAFSIQQYWLVSYDKPLSWAYDLSSVIHVFRMPLFFMISGFFAFVLLQKQTVYHFISTKFIRIGLPLLSVLIILNIPQFYTLEYLSTLEGYGSINSGNFTQHLWFLVNLLTYFIVYSVIHVVVVRTRVPSTLVNTSIFMLFALLCMPLVYLCMLALNKVGVPIYEPIPLVGSVFTLFSYFDYFLIGVVFALLSHNTTMATLQSRQGILIFIPLLIVSAIPWLLSNAINNITMPYIQHIQAITVSLIVWVLANRTFDIDYGWFKALMNASYTIYLFHHGVIILLVLGLNAINHHANVIINPYIAFFLVLFSSFAMTLFIHFFMVNKSSKLRLLFNGKQS